MHTVTTPRGTVLYRNHSLSRTIHFYLSLTALFPYGLTLTIGETL